MRALLCLGRLTALYMVEPRRVIDTGGKWLAWDRRTLHICTVSGKTHAKLPNGVVKKHNLFHGAPPKGEPFKGDCPKPVGALRPVGLIRGLIYWVPKGIKSPTKNGAFWKHKFGDTGHRGGTYPTRVMPALMEDSVGNLFIRRRPGNIYNVDEWVRG